MYILIGMSRVSKVHRYTISVEILQIGRPLSAEIDQTFPFDV